MKNWVKRALRTFFQTAIGYFLGTIPTIDWSDGKLRWVLIGVGASSIAAGLSAVMNYIDDNELF